MVTIKNINSVKIPLPFLIFVEDISKAITSGLYTKDESVKKMVNNFISKINYEISKSKTKPTVKKVPTLKTSVEIKSLSIDKIFVDPPRFQNRSKLNETTVKNIVDNFKETDLDPLVIWLDNKDDKFYLLAGHHRLEALKRLNKNIVPVKIANKDYPSEKDAIRYARELSNSNRTLETPIERAKIYRDKIAAGLSKKEIEQQAAKEGKNKTFILNLAYLNPKGSVIQALESFDSVTDKQNSNEIEKQADWIGAARKQFTELTNAHENEMFTFLNDSASSKRMKTKASFLQYINSAAGAFDFDPSKILNLKRFKYKTEGESNYDSEVTQVKESISILQDNIDSIKQRFVNPQNKDYIKTTLPQYDEIKRIADNKIAEYNRDIKIFQTNLSNLYQNKSSFINSGANQFGMFGNMIKPLQENFIIPQFLINVDDFEPYIKTVVGSENIEHDTKAKGLRYKGPINPLFNVKGATGAFLGRLERKPQGSIIITLDAKQGAGKTTACWKFMNDVAGSGYKVLFASLEEHPSSNLFQEKIDNYIDPQNVDAISVLDGFDDYEEFKKEVELADFIFIDSWQKLEKMLPKIDMDADIRNAFNGKVFPIVFQQTTTGRTKGGADKVFDADVVIKGYPGDSFDQNYFIAEKNRYTNGDIQKIAYNVANHYVYDPTNEDYSNIEEPQQFITIMGE